MAKQDDLIEEVAERRVFIRLPFEAGQHGAGGGRHEFLLAVFQGPQRIQGDLGPE